MRQEFKWASHNLEIKDIHTIKTQNTIVQHLLKHWLFYIAKNGKHKCINITLILYLLKYWICGIYYEQKLRSLSILKSVDLL